MTQPHSLPNMEDQIWKGITEAISNAQNSGHLPVLELPSKSIEQPQNPGHGDYSSNIALRLAKPINMKPSNDKMVPIIPQTIPPFVVPAPNGSICPEVILA